jgi:membrane protein
VEKPTANEVRSLLLLGSEIWAVIVETFGHWNQDNCPRMAAALAFYACFSLCPVLLIALAVAGAFAGSSAAKAELVAKLEVLLRPDDIAYVFTLLESFTGHVSGRTLPLVGSAAALFTASAVFVELRGALNTIWDAKPEGGVSFLRVVYDRAISFLLVVGIGILLLMWIAAGTVLSAINAFFTNSVPVPPSLLQTLHLIVSFAVVPALLAIVYRLIPDTKIAWNDVWVGCVVATALLLVGKYCLSIYLRLNSLTSVYGAAGSLFVVLLWVYYSAQVVFLGAELTKVYANRYGSRLKGNAVVEEQKSEEC